MKKGLISNITETLRESRIKPAEPGIFSVSSIKDYVDKILKLKASKGQKIKIGKEFIKQTGVDRKDLEKERNRHPYYKKLKSKGHIERQRVRNMFNKGINTQSTKWADTELFEFLTLNESKTDVELARYFNRSIPAINAIRRRINVIKKAGKIKEMKKYILQDERTLRKKLNAQEKIK